VAAIQGNTIIDNGDDKFVYREPDGKEYTWNKSLLTTREQRMLGNGDMLTAANLVKDYPERADMLRVAYGTGRVDARTAGQDAKA
jgi:hypothetical protein